MAVILDFHCHISTPNSKLPEPDGLYYRSIAPSTPASQVLGQWTQTAVDSMAERWRSPQALKAYRSVGPLIYTEMSRRLMATDATAMLAEMAESGVSQSVVVAMDPFVPTEDILRDCARLPGLLLPFGSVDSQAEDYLERFARLLEMPILGIKFHSDLQQLPLGSPRLHAMMEVLDASEKRYLPVYLHTGNFPIYRPLEAPWEEALPGLLSAFPRLTFVCGHAGWDAPDSALEAARAFSNLYLETSWQPPRLIRHLCDNLGPERLLFGSDYPLFSQRRALRNVRAALNDTEYAQVTAGNAQRLLRL